MCRKLAQSDVGCALKKHLRVTLVIQTIEFIHVKEHQDDTENIDKLEWSVKMNIYCDQLAITAL